MLSLKTKEKDMVCKQLTSIECFISAGYASLLSISWTKGYTTLLQCKPCRILEKTKMKSSLCETGVREKASVPRH